MKKRILNLMLAAVMLCAFIPCAAYAEEQYENYTYKINSDGKGVTITGFENSEATSVVIPETIAGLPVTQIGDAAFLRSRNLKNIIIPDSVTVIGEEAFYACRELWSIYYTGTADKWQTINIGKGNDILNDTLNDADFYYGGAAPVKAAAVTVTNDGETYKVAANTKHGGKAYAAVYADGRLLRTESAPFIGGSASISPDTTGGDTVKFFVWSNYLQPLTQTEIQTVGE